MFKLYHIGSLLIGFNILCYSNASVEDETELLFTFLVHRHGDRTPIESTLLYSTDPEALISASARYGYGQLTDVGIQRGYELGQFIRRRYDGLLSPQYNKSEIYIRSTDFTRAKMTVLSAMAAVYPVNEEDNWNRDINWTPVPYTTVSAKYDFNLAALNCPTFLSAYAKLANASPPSSMAKYADFLRHWSEIIGFDITTKTILPFSIHDVYISQMSLGVPLSPELEAIFPEIQEAAGASMNIVFGNEDYIALQAGVLLNKFYSAAEQIIAGEDVPRVQVYSVHDLNVFAFEAVTQITSRQGVPKYGSAFALELRKVVGTGKYVVVPVYLNTPSEDVLTYLQVDGCDDLCTYDRFRNITSKFALKEDEWRTRCGFSDDFEFDTSSID